MEADLNLLFLPLLGGYIFYTRFNLTAYSAVRTHGQHLLFRVAACALVLLIVARLLVLVLPAVAENSDYWISRSLYSVPGLATLLLTAEVLLPAPQAPTG